MLAPPTMLNGRPYFQLHKEHSHFDGTVWLRFEQPRMVQRGDLCFAVDFTLLHGLTLDGATALNLLKGSSNGKKALVFNWPKAPRGEGRTIVSRLIGMSLLYDPDVWQPLGFTRNDGRLDVHHSDDNHLNCFVNNLKVVHHGTHVGDHNRRR